MSRTTKDPEIRRNELLHASLELFLERGAAQTSVSDIVRRVGVAQGTFYYHFKGKDELIDALADQLAIPLSTTLAQLAHDETMPVPERVEGFVATLIQAVEAGREQLSGMMIPGNEDLHDKFAVALRSRVHPALNQLVDQGNAKGSLDAEPAEEIVELILAATSHLTRCYAAGQSRERLTRLAKALETLVARTLGLRST